MGMYLQNTRIVHLEMNNVIFEAKKSVGRVYTA